MTTKGFAVSHARDARFERGLRSFFEYRDLGIEAATGGAAVAHVIRAVPGATVTGLPHLHRTTFQLVYVLKGWIEFEYEGQGMVRLEAGSCVYQPASSRTIPCPSYSNSIHPLRTYTSWKSAPKPRQAHRSVAARRDGPRLSGWLASRREFCSARGKWPRTVLFVIFARIFGRKRRICPATAGDATEKSGRSA